MLLEYVNVVIARYHWEKTGFAEREREKNDITGISNNNPPPLITPPVSLRRKRKQRFLMANPQAIFVKPQMEESAG